jgi:hypothetical protein
MFPLAKEILRHCSKEHGCKAQSRNAGTSHSSDALPDGRRHEENCLDVLPSRFISLNAFRTGDASADETADACLVEMDMIPPGTKVDYAALSYCWGPNPDAMYKTETASLDERRKRIRWAELPTTFQDAFRICRRMRIPALWIDAICIVQDSTSDWEAESANMGGIYASSVVTIAADASDSVDGGILAPLGSEEEPGLPGTVSVTNLLESGRESTLVFYDSTSTAPGSTWTPPAILESPLSNRAWCMQERILSPRTLHFTKKGLIWECRDLYFSFVRWAKYEEMNSIRTVAAIPTILSEGLPKLPLGLQVWEMNGAAFTDELADILDTSLRTGMSHDWRFSLDPGLNRVADSRDKVLWWNHNIVAPYSARRVRFVSDRLPAISGLARLFAPQVCAPYAAGLWLAELDESLEWGRAGDTLQDAKLPGYPSFSWAAHPGPVAWVYHADTRAGGRAFDLVGYHVTPAGPDPYGSVAEAHLTLRGHVRALKLGGEQVDSTGETVRAILDDLGNSIGAATLDLDSHRHKTFTTAHGFLLYKNFVGILRLLLLAKVENSGAREYKRIGIGMITRRHASCFGEAEIEEFRIT